MENIIKYLSPLSVDSILESVPNRQLFKRMEHFAVEHNIPVIDSVNGGLLVRLVRASKPALVLEIGTGLGLSTSLIRGCLEKESLLITVDHSIPSIFRAKQFCALDICEIKIHFVLGRGCEILSSIQKNFDLIFVDCNIADYLDLLHLGLKKISTNGIVVFDNVGFHDRNRKGMKRDKFLRIKNRIQIFLDQLSCMEGVSSHIFGQGDGLLVVYRNEY